MGISNVRRVAIEYLARHSVMSLATQGPEGIWSAAVFYVNDGLTIYFLSSPESRHGVNLDANPSVACTIQEDCAEWREIKGIQLEGTATKLAGLEQAKALARFGMKFPVIRSVVEGEIAKALAGTAWYKVTPSRVYFIDNSVGFAHRDLIFP